MARVKCHQARLAAIILGLQRRGRNGSGRNFPCRMLYDAHKVGGGRCEEKRYCRTIRGRWVPEWPSGEGRRGASPPSPSRRGFVGICKVAASLLFLSSRYLDILPPLLFAASKDSLGIPQTSTDPRGRYKKVVEVAAGRKRKFQCQNLLRASQRVFARPTLPSSAHYTPTLPRSSVCPRREGREGKDVNQSGHLPPNSPPLPATYCAPYLPRLRLRRKWRMRRGR